MGPAIEQDGLNRNDRLKDLALSVVSKINEISSCWSQLAKSYTNSLGSRWDILRKLATSTFFEPNDNLEKRIQQEEKFLGELLRQMRSDYALLVRLRKAADLYFLSIDEAVHRSNSGIQADIPDRIAFSLFVNMDLDGREFYLIGLKYINHLAKMIPEIRQRIRVLEEQGLGICNKLEIAKARHEFNVRTVNGLEADIQDHRNHFIDRSIVFIDPVQDLEKEFYEPRIDGKYQFDLMANHLYQIHRLFDECCDREKDLECRKKVLAEVLEKTTFS